MEDFAEKTKVQVGASRVSATKRLPFILDYIKFVKVYLKMYRKVVIDSVGVRH